MPPFEDETDTTVDVTSAPVEAVDTLDLEGVDNEDFTEDELAEIEKLKAGGDDEPDTGDGGDEGAGDDTRGEGKPPQGFVSINALHEARREIKELKEKFAPLEEFKDKLALRLLEVRNKKPEEQQEEIPDENKDPVGAIAYLKNYTKKLEERLAERDNQNKEEREKAEKSREEAEISAKRTEFVLETANTLLEKTAEKNPDVQEAFEVGIQGLKGALEKKGFTGQKLEQALNQAVYQYAFNAPNDLDEFADYVRANARYFGWTPGQPKPEPKKGETAAEKIGRLKRAKNASKTLGDGGGGSEIGLADLANMSAEELEQLAMENPDLFEAAASRD